MRTDCTTCPARDLHCEDCMVPVLLHLAPPRPVVADLAPALDERECEALAMLHDNGMITLDAITSATLSTTVRGLRSVG